MPVRRYRRVMSDGDMPPAKRVPLAPDAYLDHVQADLAAIAAIPTSGLDAPVTTCPGWVVADVIAHLGQVLASVAAALSVPAGQRSSAPEIADGQDPLEYFSANAAALLDALEAGDPDELRPNWAGVPTASFFWRRIAQETLIHRYDIESSFGDAATIDPLMAIDGIDELCRVLIPNNDKRLTLPSGGETVHFHVVEDDETLPPGEWMITFGPGPVTTETTHGKGDIAYRGGAADLLLFAWNRSTIGVTAFGDGDPLEWWRDNVTF